MAWAKQTLDNPADQARAPLPPGRVGPHLITHYEMQRDRALRLAADALDAASLAERLDQHTLARSYEEVAESYREAADLAEWQRQRCDPL